jgi:hypothetical protein
LPKPAGACWRDEIGSAYHPLLTSAVPAARPPAPARPQASTIDSTKYVDGISDEDAIVNAKLHGICHGC